jgi:predicted nucleic-acid-binding protein
MLAVDTNVVVRFLTADHPRQFEQANALMAANEIRITVTVILETEWVLRDGYRYPREAVAAALSGLLSLPSVRVEHEARIRQALDWTASGMDFADALHVAGALDCEAFVSFDRDLLRVGKRIGLAVQAP